MNEMLMIEPISQHRTSSALSKANYSGAKNDAELVKLWLDTKASEHTKRAYKKDVENFAQFLRSQGKTFHQTKVTDFKSWVDSLKGSEATRARRTKAIKSLFGFAHKLGYLPFNIGGVVEAPKVPNQLAERILDIREVRLMMNASKGRNHALIRFLYNSGARISEACALRWKHVHPQSSGEASITLHGKGGRTRHVLISEKAFSTLSELQPDPPNAEKFVFETKSGRPLHPANVRTTIRAIAKRAGVRRAVSPHRFRHSNATHALDAGAPISLVKASLGHASLTTTGQYVHANPKDGTCRYLTM